jgi:hypothetical protein
MTRFFSFTFVAILLLFHSSFSVAPESIRIEMSNGTIILKANNAQQDSASLTPSWSSFAFTKAFGKCNRVVGDVSVYDKLGINTWIVPVNKVTEFHVNFYNAAADPDHNAGYIPRTMYSGLFVVDGYQVTVSDSPQMLRDGMTTAGWEETNAFIDHNYEFIRNGIHIFFQFDPEEKHLEHAAIGLEH